jgi:hypothetical protein
VSEFTRIDAILGTRARPPRPRDGTAYPLETVQSVWLELVGELSAAAAQPHSIRGDTLLVTVVKLQSRRDYTKEDATEQEDYD